MEGDRMKPNYERNLSVKTVTVDVAFSQHDTYYTLTH